MKQSKKLNGNILARTITLQEGQRISLPISQVKEVIRLLRAELRNPRKYPAWIVVKWLWG